MEQFFLYIKRIVKTIPPFQMRGALSGGFECFIHKNIPKPWRSYEIKKSNEKK